MSLAHFLQQLKQHPQQIQFADSMAVIDAEYHFTPTAFRNGNCHNKAGQNNGSCKILAFGQLQQLSVEETLACFGAFYRDDVLAQPQGQDHQNIRQFMVSGWDGVEFPSQPLKKR